MPYEPISLPTNIFSGLVILPVSGTLDPLPEPPELTSILITPAAVTFNALDAVLTTIDLAPAEITFDSLP